MYLKKIDKTLIVDMLKIEIPGLQAVYLFGSQKDNTANNESDVDIAYLTPDRLSSLACWDLSQKLASLLSRDVDLVELAQTKPSLDTRSFLRVNVFMALGMK